ncbi:serine/threonine-protein phosphatase rdgC-like isoform X1 [Anopheles merus]|uniref:serine/threonine-protein phosphatase rdgC-like isoform X1 n=1 Tax=Anopheles merus TaxID=30066 RepID=UPI001BE475FD|nr:serine/threonine-protein phosphatase rdgC-like isoform X1 [Anopheles merus]XP_041783490.1 serine/threonine-protein phosphatase rdgC-like isoform X1 [Anopheles merus]XP_041783491.1 serine/threonine-protein phosphatase rdgC-like isoform X1 [Anopheles merus]XP_041783492.1 serine/threonine-protein phosphatase rdgC-like isoform X1 [Anopheles merus]XP_041783493.1 serine/threonine-protein phosphatase rdgC-like isoform X1 [Anopheles merus]
MLRNCGCFQRARRSSSFEDSSSCRSSEIERGGEMTPHSGSLLKLFTSKGWCRQWRKSGRGMSMTKIERTMKAAILIQRWYRRFLARIEIRRRYTWTIFQSIEYAGEQDQVRLYNFFNALLTHIPETAGRPLDSQNTSRSSSAEALNMKFSDESDDLADEGITGPERGYQGPDIKFPLDKKELEVIIDLFRKKKNRLHAKYVAGILREATSKLKRLPNLNQASTAISKQVTICGDLHGKLDDLLVVFHKNGLPSPENPYVFNGDFVDRGKKGLEVLLLLLCTFLVFPGGVFLNRGNHEDTVMNARYGFIREVHQKYKHNAERLLKLIDEVYRWLPLGTIVNNRVLVVHGGISDSTDLDLIRSLDRGKYISLLRPPITESTAPGAEIIDKVEWKQVFDILWSDPQHTEGCRPNSLRGAGTYFGPDVTSKFLQRYKLQYLVRSHECKPDGHEIMHGGKVITIFSASNYYEIGSNKGAYLKLDPQLDTHFVMYTAAASKTRKLTFRQRVGLVESSALRELAAKLRERRIELEREFKSRDPENKGVLPLAKWCEALESATSLGLPWRMLKDKLAPADNPTASTVATVTEVSYRKTLHLLDTDSFKSAQNGTTSVAESLYKNKSSLEAIFRILDKDNSGQISLEEFGEACELLRRHFPHNTHEQLLDMCRMMDINKDGLVDLNEFLETFRLCENAKEQLLMSLEERAIAENNGNGSGSALDTIDLQPSGPAASADRKKDGLPDRNGNCAAKTASEDCQAKTDGRRRSKKRASGKRANSGPENGAPEADEDTDDYEDYEANEPEEGESREKSAGPVNGTVISSSNTAAVANSTANGDTHKDTIVA